MVYNGCKHFTADVAAANKSVLHQIILLLILIYWLLYHSRFSEMAYVLLYNTRFVANYNEFRAVLR